MDRIALKPTFTIVSNRAEYPLAQTDDITAAGIIVDALMVTRRHPEWIDYWVIDDAGNEYYHHAEMGTVFSASCFA